MTDENFIFLLLGKTGNGKSATGNSILGSNAFYSDDSNEAVTNMITMKSAVRGSYQVTVIDTPGFMDTQVDENEAKSKACADMRKAMTQCPTNGKLALVVVLKYGERHTNDNKLSFHILKQIFGEENVRKSCIIVMTHGEMYDIKYKGKKCFEEWMKERTGELGVFLKMCGYKCVLFSNETDQEGLKDKLFETLIELVKTLDQGYTQSKFESEKNHQSRLELESEIQNLKECYDKEIERMHNEIKSIGGDPKTIKELDKMDTVVTQLINNVNEKDSPHAIFYAEGENRLLEKTRNSLNEIEELIAKKRETLHQMAIAEELKNKIEIIKRKIKRIQCNKIEIKNIESCRKDIESLDLTNLGGAIRIEMDEAVDSTCKKLHKVEKRVIHFLNVEHSIQVLTDKNDALGIPCRLSHLTELQAECESLFQEVEKCISNNEDRGVLTKHLDVIKNAITDKKKENDMFSAGELINEIESISKKIKGIKSNEIEIKSVLSVIRKDIDSLDLTKLDGDFRTEMATKVDKTKKELDKVENRVSLFLNLDGEIQVLADKYHALGIPCRRSQFNELRAECDKLLEKVKMYISNNEDSALLKKRLKVLKNGIMNLKKENDK